MVQIYRKTYEYPDSPPIPLLAFFLRYPNPFARHVLSVDVLSRTVDPSTGQIHTTRLILKRGILPKWAKAWLPTGSGGSGLDAYVLEESTVDPPGWTDEPEVPVASGSGSSSPSDLGSADSVGIISPIGATEESRSMPRLRMWQANLNHRRIMHVVEKGELRAGPNGTTIHTTSAEIRSDLGGAWSSLIRRRIESYGLSKFEVNSETARQGMSLVLSRLRNRQPLPDTAEFYPPPPPAFGDSWQNTSGGGESGSSSASATSGPKEPSWTARTDRSPASFFLSPGTLEALRGRYSRGGAGRPDDRNEMGGVAGSRDRDGQNRDEG